MSSEILVSFLVLEQFFLNYFTNDVEKAELINEVTDI